MTRQETEKQDKEGRLPRHSGDPKSSAYGGAEKREGGGKGNWGKVGDNETQKLDKNDPMYDSEAEEQRAALEKARQVERPAADAGKPAE